LDLTTVGLTEDHATHAVSINASLTLNSYDDTDLGYLRVMVNVETLTIEFHPHNDGGTTKTPDDTVTVTLATHSIQ
jgi:hypothetical protein